MGLPQAKPEPMHERHPMHEPSSTMGPVHHGSADEAVSEVHALVAAAHRDLVQENTALSSGESALFLAELAHRLAEKGQAEKVTVTVRGTREAAETVQAFLAERRRTAALRAALEASRVPSSQTGACAIWKRARGLCKRARGRCRTPRRRPISGKPGLWGLRGFVPGQCPARQDSCPLLTKLPLQGPPAPGKGPGMTRDDLHDLVTSTSRERLVELVGDLAAVHAEALARLTTAAPSPPAS